MSQVGERHRWLSVNTSGTPAPTAVCGLRSVVTLLSAVHQRAMHALEHAERARHRLSRSAGTLGPSRFLGEAWRWLEADAFGDVGKSI